MNFIKTTTLLRRKFTLVGFVLLLLSMATIIAGAQDAQQRFSGVEPLVRSTLPRGFQGLEISDTSPDADKIVRDMTNGNYPANLIVYQHFLTSEKPITANQIRFARRVVDIELANATLTAVLSDYAEILAMIDPANEAAVMKIISYSCSMAVVQSKRTELQISYSAEHPSSGREIYGIVSFYSVQKPNLDIDSITDVSANSRRIPFSQSPESRQAGVNSTLDFVNEVLASDSQLAIFREFFNRLRGGE